MEDETSVYVCEYDEMSTFNLFFSYSYVHIIAYMQYCFFFSFSSSSSYSLLLLLEDIILIWKQSTVTPSSLELIQSARHCQTYWHDCLSTLYDILWTVIAARGAEGILGDDWLITRTQNSLFCMQTRIFSIYFHSLKYSIYFWIISNDECCCCCWIEVCVCIYVIELDVLFSLKMNSVRNKTILIRMSSITATWFQKYLFYLVIEIVLLCLCLFDSTRHTRTNII